MPKSEHPKAGTLYLVHVLTHATRTILDNALADIGLSAFQYTILDVIDRNARLSSSKVARCFHVTPQAMGELILNLERRGLIKRQEDPKNRKILHLLLSREGKRAVTAGNKIRRELEEHLFAPFSAQQMQDFRDLLSVTLDRVHKDRA